jgi:hypothetical protein
MNVLCVSAFKDINRGKWDGQWSEWNRTNDQYIDWFNNIVKSPLNLVCFCENDIAEKIKNKTGFTNCYNYNIEDTFFKYYENEKNIMNSDSYKNVVGSRYKHPEHSIPEYNLVQHSKTSFIRRASELFPNYTHYVWIDFGYLRSESDIQREINWEKINDNKIHYASFCDIFDNNIMSPKDMCKYAPESIQGSIIITPKNLTHWYEEQYSKILTEDYSNYIHFLLLICSPSNLN